MKYRILTRSLLALLLFSIASRAQMPGQQPDASAELPVPSGSFAIGRSTLHLTDNARPDVFSSTPGKHRELMVYIWYPARPLPNAPSGEYFPYAGEIDKNPDSKQAALDMLGASWKQIVAGSLRSHAIPDAPPAAESERFPVILFSHGYSATTFSYTAQIEDFVSHGYVVVAVEHTDAAGLVRFPDHHVRLFRNPPAPPSATTPLQAMIASAKQGTQIGAEDLRFVLDALGKESFPLSKLIDLRHVAAVGHSYGGTVSARACQLDARIQACVSEDGEVNPVGAFFDYPDHASMKQPFLFIELAGRHTDAELARMGETRLQWNGFLAHEHEQIDQCGAGSYFVSLDRPGMAHSSFSDGPILNATDATLASVALANLRLTERLERSFLDKYLKGAPAPLLDQPDKAESGMIIERVGQ
jgi:predicted dienelactone hydrolase